MRLTVVARNLCSHPRLGVESTLAWFGAAFAFQQRSAIPVNGKREMRTYFLLHAAQP